MAIDPRAAADPRAFRPLRLAARAACIAGLAAIAVLSLATFDSPDMPGGDKAQHAFAYFAVATAGFTGFKRRTHLRLFVVILVFGAAIEVAQAVFTDTRIGDPSDFLADLIGVILGWLAALAARAVVRTAGWA